MSRLSKMMTFLACFVVMILCTLFGSDTFAASMGDIYTWNLINYSSECYNKALVEEIRAGSYAGFNSLFKEGVELPVYIPTISSTYSDFRNSNEYYTTCTSLFIGNQEASEINKSQGLFSIYGSNGGVPGAKPSITELNEFMTTRMGYDATMDKASDKAYCYTIYERSGAEGVADYVLGSYCRNSDNKPDRAESMVFSGGDGKYVVTGEIDDGSFHEMKITATRVSDRREYYIKYFHSQADSPYGNGDKYNYGDIIDEKPAQTYVNVGSPRRPRKKLQDVDNIYARVIVQKDETNQSSNTIYKKTSESWKKFLSSVTSLEDRIKFSPTAKHSLYKEYLKKHYVVYGYNGVASDNCQSSRPEKLVNEDENKYYIFEKSKGQWCTVAVSSSDDGTVKAEHTMTVFSEGQDYVLDKVIKTLPELIELMGALDVENDNSEPTPSPIPSPEDPELYEPDKCYAGSGNLGWILCPVITAVTGVGEHMWEQIETHHLQVPAQAIFGNDSGVYEAWKMMRGIANTIFVILFLFVVFSQLTGLGIDNYGVKKILPKLIIIVILINLSYLICELAVDLSNIFGKGLNDLFSDMAKMFSRRVLIRQL